jgi:hypothetical protein
VDRERGAYGTVGSRAGAGDQQVELLVPETPPSRALSALALNLLSVVFFYMDLFVATAILKYKQFLNRV